LAAKFAKAEWARVVPALVNARSLAQHELSTVESLPVRGTLRECEIVIQKHGLTFLRYRCQFAFADCSLASTRKPVASLDETGLCRAPTTPAAPLAMPLRYPRQPL
jgi:hypothetical protein